MIARDEKLLASVRGRKGCAGRIVRTSGQELQGEKGMSRAAIAQIDLDRVGFPGLALVRARHDKIAIPIRICAALCVFTLPVHSSNHGDLVLG